MSIFEQGLAPAAVNHIALTPLSFIERTASVYPHYPAVIHGNIRRDWAQTYQRCRRHRLALYAPASGEAPATRSRPGCDRRKRPETPRGSACTLAG